MSIEKALADLQEAIETLTATIKGRKGAAASSEDAAEEEPAPQTQKKRKGKKAKEEVTVEQVREALMALNEAKGKQAAVDVLAQFGVKKIGDLEEAQYAECKEAAETATAEEEGGEEDELFE